MLASPTTIIRDGDGNAIDQIVEFSIKLQMNDPVIYVNYMRYKTDEKGVVKVQQNDTIYNIIQAWEATLLACKTTNNGLEIMVTKPQWMGEHRVAYGEKKEN
jgi:hypothetical protein